MNDTGQITLDLDELDTRALALCWGLASSYAKDGNLLFSRLSNCFEREYAIRTGKGSTVNIYPLKMLSTSKNIQLRICGRRTLISLVYRRPSKATAKDPHPNFVTQ